MTTHGTAAERPVANRRSVLKGIGAGVAATTLLGSAGSAIAGRTNPFDTPNANYVEGESTSVAGTDPDVWTFATSNRAGKPTHLGIWLEREAFETLTAEPEHRVLSLDFPAVDGLTYTFAGINWNPMGHPPASVWTTPHFDFHYYFVDQSLIEGIVGPAPGPVMGIATYDVPDEYFAENYVYESPRLIVPEMGEHIYDETSPEWDPEVPFTHTYIYGLYDPSIDPTSPSGTVVLPFGPGGSLVPVPTYEGDGMGELTFTEPMITEAFMRDVEASGVEVTTPVPLPAAFPEAGYYPTSYTTRYVGSADAYAITLENFEWVDAYSA
jgi:hypothetical protein